MPLEVVLLKFSLKEFSKVAALILSNALDKRSDVADDVYFVGEVAGQTGRVDRHQLETLFLFVQFGLPLGMVDEDLVDALESLL